MHRAPPSRSRATQHHAPSSHHTVVMPLMAPASETRARRPVVYAQRRRFRRHFRRQHPCHLRIHQAHHCRLPCVLTYRAPPSRSRATQHHAPSSRHTVAMPLMAPASETRARRPVACAQRRRFRRHFRRQHPYHLRIHQAHHCHRPQPCHHQSQPAQRGLISCSCSMQVGP